MNENEAWCYSIQDENANDWLLLTFLFATVDCQIQQLSPIYIPSFRYYYILIPNELPTPRTPILIHLNSFYTSLDFLFQFENYGSDARKSIAGLWWWWLLLLKWGEVWCELRRESCVKVVSVMLYIHMWLRFPRGFVGKDSTPFPLVLVILQPSSSSSWASFFRLRHRNNRHLSCWRFHLLMTRSLNCNHPKT